MAKLVVFLGNPGTKYTNTRHNTAWLFCNFIDRGFSWQNKFHGLFAKQGDYVYLKPQTYMNESGISVSEACSFFNIKPQDVLIIHDDIELPFSSVKIQAGGGMGGHNGLRSVKQHLSTDAFYRLRIGVGRPEGIIDVASYVLQSFSELEKAQLESIFNNAKDLLESF